MRHAAVLMGLLAAGLAMPAAAQNHVAVYDSVGPADADPVDATTQAEDVKFKDDGAERMTVPVELAGQGPYRFLVDTGADRTALSKEIADRLQLPRGASATLHSVTGAQEVQTATVHSLRLTSKPIRVENAPLLSEFNMGADGILGVDSLRSQRVMIDFRTNTLSVVPSAQKLLPEERDKDTIVITARQRKGRLVLTNARAEGGPVAVVLDTGSQVTIGNDALRRKLLKSSRGDISRFGQVRLRSVTGEELIGNYMVMKKLEIGGATLSDLSVVFADAHTFRKLNLEKEPALLLGMNAMRVFDRVSIDFARKKLRLILPEHSSSGRVMFAAIRPR